MTTPPSTDFYGYLKIDDTNFKEFEPKLPTDEFWSECGKLWIPISRLIESDDSFSKTIIYRRRIAIPDEWELVPLDDSIADGFIFTLDGVNWKTSLYGHDACLMRDIIVANPHIKAIIRRKEPMVGGTELKMPEILSGKQEFDTAKFLAEKDAFAKTPEGQEIARRARASAERLVKAMEQSKQEEVCECGHKVGEHCAGPIGEDWCGWGSCRCQKFKPKSKGGQVIGPIQEIYKSTMKDNSQPAPETESAEVGAEFRCATCGDLLEQRPFKMTEIVALKPCQRCLDAAKGEWVDVEKEPAPSTEAWFDIQTLDGIHSISRGCDITKDRHIRWLKRATIPEPPPVNGRERDDALLDGFMSDFLKHHSWPMRPDLRSLIRETAAAAIAYKRSRAK